MLFDNFVNDVRFRLYEQTVYGCRAGFVAISGVMPQVARWTATPHPRRSPWPVLAARSRDSISLVDSERREYHFFGS
jgi:hypothetical protein